MKQKFKWLLALVAMVASVNLMATDVTFDFKALATNTSGTVDGIGWGTGKTGSASATVCNATNGLVLYGVSGGGGYFNTTSATSGKITGVALVTTAKKNTPTYTAYGSTDGTNWTSIEAGIATGEKNLDLSSASYTYFKIENTTGATAQLGVSSITITYAGSAKTLSSIAISGTPSKTTYEAGETFDPAGLIVKGTYDDASEETITSGITWGVTPTGALTAGTTSVSVTATVSGKTSAAYQVNGLTVNAHQITPGTYDIALNDAFWGTNYGGTFSLSANSLSLNGKQYDVSLNMKNGTSTNGYINATHTRAYNQYNIKFSVPAGYNLTKIVFVEYTDANKWGGTLSSDKGTMNTTNNKIWEGSTNDVTISFSGTCAIEKVTVTYIQDIKSTITFANPANGTLTIKNGSTTLSSGAEVSQGTVLDVAATRTSAAYRLKEIKVVKTEGSDDVTSDVYNATTGELTMPAYPITVSAIMEDNNYLVTFHSNTTPAQEDKTQIFTYTKAANLTANAFTAPTGYDFYKWATTAQGEGTIADGAEYTLASEANADLYAKWVAKTIEVTLNANGSGTDGLALIDYDATVVGGIEHVAAWAEHELLGYYTAATEGDKILNADGTFAGNVAEWIVNGKWAKDADCELFAQWKTIEKYSISYDLTGCTANAGNPTEIALADASITLNFALAENYTWTDAEVDVTMGGNSLESTEYDFTDGVLVITPASGFKGNIEAIIYCDFAPATLTLKENGSDRPYGENLKVNSSVTLPDCDVTCDKKFMGWSESNTDYSNLMDAGEEYTMATTAVTLYAWFATETPGTEQTVFSEDFNACEGKGANDSEGWSGNVASTALPTSITGWTFTKGNAAYQCAKFGTGSDQGSATTPALNCTGDGVLTFKAGAWNGSSENTGLSISATEGVSLKDAEGNAISSVTMTKGAWTSYTIYVYGMQKSSKITFVAGTTKNNRFFLDEVVLKQAGAPSYNDYSLICSAKASAPIFDLAEGTYTVAKELNITAEDGATIYYTKDGSEPDNTKTLYTGAIQLDTYGKVTIKAIAILDGKDPSDVTSAEYTMNLPFTSLEQLAAANVQSGTEITITFPKTQIKSLAGTKGVYFNIQKEGKDIEIYCNSTDFSNTWEAGGYLSATNLTCQWKRFVKSDVFQCWELTPSNWDAFEYSDPDPYTSVAELYAAGLVDGAKVYLNITNAYVHAKTYTSPNNFVYVQDDEVGIVLRTSEFADDNIGKLMTAKIVGNLAYSNGRPQIAVTSMSEVSYTAGDRPTANATTLSASEEASQILSLVKIDGYFAQSQDKQAKTAVITENADGTGASYTIYNLFNALKTVPESDKAINVKGLFYKKVESNVTSYSIVPVLVEDVALVSPADAVLPSLNIEGGASQAAATEVGSGEVIEITPAAGFTTYYKLNDAVEWIEITKQVEPISLTEDTKLEIKSSRDYYTDVTATYYYKINALLTKYAITIPSYSKTHASVATSVASELAGQTVTITISNVEEHFSVKTVSVVKTADTEQSAADVTNVSDGVYTFTMPACEVTIKVSYNQEKRYSIIYQKGGIQAQGEDITEAAQYEGTVLTLKECTWTSDNYVFKGWKAQYNDGEKDVELPITNNTITVPAYDVKIIAQWNKIASYDWVLVTDASTLEAGDYVVIASNAQGKVATSSITSGYMGEVAATFSSEKDYLNSVPTGTAVLTLGGTADAWTLSDKDGRKLGATAAKNVAWDGQSATNTWTISVDANTYAATIQNTHKTNNSYDYGRFLHNVNSTRFTTYTSAANNTMLLPQLYKAVEHTYVVKYHLNGGANKPADSHANADGKVTITTDVPTYTAHKFLGWNAEQDGSGQVYVGGQEYTIEDDITIYAQWQQVEKYAVTYIANGATEGTAPTETEKYEASKFSVKGQGSLLKENYVFTGWSDGNNIYHENDEYTMPNHAVTFTAQWADANISNWHLVTTTKMLTVGDQIIIAAADYDYAMGAHSGDNKYRNPIAVTKKVDTEHFNDGKLLVGQNSPVVLTLVEGAVEETFALYDGSKYIVPASSSNKMDKADDVTNASSWAITIDDEGVTTIVSQAEGIAHKSIRYNESSGQERFSCYGETTCKAVVIYKYIEGEKTVREVSADTYTTFCIPQGVEVGNFYGATFWNIADKTFMTGDQRLYSITIEQEEGNLGAGVPYIMLPDAETTEFVYYATGEEETAGTNNGLYGTFVDYAFDENEATARDAQQLYVISNGTLYLCGTGCGVYANRAYIKSNMIDYVAPSGAPRRTIGRPNVAPTVLENIFGNQSAGKVQKVFIDGQIYIIRDTKMYNTQGQLVK